MSLELIHDVSLFQNELKLRLPKSANVHNMAKFYERFQMEMKFYMLQKDLEGSGVGSNTWIFVIYQRQDFGQDISISAPNDPFQVFTPEEVKIAFTGSNLIDWNKAYHFTALDRAISPPFVELSWIQNGNVTLVIPDYFYYLEPDTAATLALDGIETGDNDRIELKSIASNEGVEFLKQTWKHAAENCDDYLENLLRRNESRGVYLNGEIVSGIIFNGTGFLAMLHTVKASRRRGFGKQCMRSLISVLGKAGYVPCCSVDVKNTASRAFQISVGLKEAHMVDYILYCAEQFD